MHIVHIWWHFNSLWRKFTCSCNNKAKRNQWHCRLKNVSQRCTETDRHPHPSVSAGVDQTVVSVSAAFVHGSAPLIQSHLVVFSPASAEDLMTFIFASLVMLSMKREYPANPPHQLTSTGSQWGYKPFLLLFSTSYWCLVCFPQSTEFPSWPAAWWTQKQWSCLADALLMLSGLETSQIHLQLPVSGSGEEPRLTVGGASVWLCEMRWSLSVGGPYWCCATLSTWSSHEWQCQAPTASWQLLRRC